MDIYESVAETCAKMRACGEVNDKTVIKEIREVISLLMDLANMTRTQGLLELESRGEELSEDMGIFGVKYLKQLILLVVDGTDPQEVSDIAYLIYSANKFPGKNGLIYLLFMKAMLAIQAGVNPRLLEQTLMAMLPEEIKNRLDVNEMDETRNTSNYQYDDSEDFLKSPEELQDESVVKAIYELFGREEEEVEFGSVGDIFNLLFESLGKKDIQKVISEISIADVGIALMGANSKAKTRVFCAMAENMRHAVAVDMIELQYALSDTIVQVQKEILKKMLYLNDRYDIVLNKEAIERIQFVVGE